MKAKAYETSPSKKPPQIKEDDDARITRAIQQRQNIDAYNRDALRILERVRTGDF